MMWPFNRKPEPKPVSFFTPKPNPFNEFRKAGDTFNYLGRTCVVKGIGDWRGSGTSFYMSPVLYAQYADEQGRIRDIEFGEGSIPALLKMNTERDLEREIDVTNLASSAASGENQ